VGGIRGQVRAPTREEAWAKFERDGGQLEEEFGLFLDASDTGGGVAEDVEE
jgi:hypothetical protein